MRRARGWLRPLLSTQHVLHQYVKPALLLASFRRWDAVAVGGSSLIALTIPQRGLPTNSSGSESEGFFFPLSQALTSVMRLAVDDVNAREDIGLLAGENLTLAVFGVEAGSGAMEGLCDALEAVGENGTFGVIGPMLSSQASLLETMSNEFFGLPLVTPSASASRAVTSFASRAQGLDTEASFLFGTQPDVFMQMKALARLILDKKTERDTSRGWYYPTERVSVIYSDDVYGSVAASAFTRAARTTTGTNIDYNMAGHIQSTIDIAVSVSVEVAAGTDYRPTLLSLLENHASIIVLLAEGYDGRFVRSVLEQARDIGLVSENTQWYLNGEAARDSTFTVNDTYHDSQLAYDLRGTWGARPCPPFTGPGSDQILALTSKWVSLNSDVYPGAGPGSLAPDGRLDPLLAYAYDAVFALASSIRAEQITADAWGSSFPGFVTESCPFRTEGLWEYGEPVRSSTLEVEFVGVTGSVAFQGGEKLVLNAAGAAGTGWRQTNGTTFCALNLQPHASLGATLVTVSAWRPGDPSDTTGVHEPFQRISPFQKNQTYPAGGKTYPFDRPVLRGLNLEVLTEEAAVPFATISGRETTTSDYKGIALDLMQVLSARLGFTYNITVANSSVSPDTAVASIAEGKYDILASWISISSGRMDSVSFSYPYYSTGVSFVYRVAIVDEVSWWKMFQPFEISLWVAVFVATAVVFVLLWVFDGGKNDSFTSKVAGGSGRKRELVRGMGMTTYVTGALLMGQMAHEPYTLEGYIISSGWMFFCFIIGASFTAELASFLSAEEETVLTFGISDLRSGRVSHSQVALWQGTTLQTFYEEEIMECFSEKNCTEGFVGHNPVSCYTLNECFALVANGTCKITLVDSATANFRVANDFCGLKILPETFKAEQYGLVLERGSPYLGEFRQALLDLGEAGIIDEISAPYFDSSRCAYLEAYDDAKSSSQNLTLIDMGGVFLVLGAFVVVSTVMWMCRHSPPAMKMQKWFRAQRELREIEKTDQDAVSLYPDLDETEGDISEAPENGSTHYLDGTPNSLPRLSRTNSVGACTGRPSPIAEESKSGHGQSSKDSKLLNRSRSPHQDDANHEKPVPVKFEETKDNHRTEEAW